MFLMVSHAEGEPWRNPLRDCNCIRTEVSGASRPSVKLTVQGQDYPDHWIRILLPSTVTSRSVPGMSLLTATTITIISTS